MSENLKEKAENIANEAKAKSENIANEAKEKAEEVAAEVKQTVENVAKEAKERELTRAYVSMERAMKIPQPVIYVVGNAPTALISLMEASSKNGYRPAFIIGVPVGFVNVEAAKEMVEAGATRLGTSSGIKIIEEMKAAGYQ